MIWFRKKLSSIERQQDIDIADDLRCELGAGGVQDDQVWFDDGVWREDAFQVYRLCPVLYAKR